MKEKFKKPPLTYYGGKQSMLQYIIPLIPAHKIYDEPFFGGGAVFFAKEPSKIEFINDTNGEIVNFYRVIKRDFDKLKIEVDCTLHSEFQHKQAIDIYRNSADKDAVLRAWAVWMLSHRSIYAIFCNSWKCSKERNVAKQIQTKKEQFDQVYVKRLEATSIFARDGLDVIAKTDTPETFHYVDPPYFNANMGHYGGYKVDSYEKLLRLLASIKGKFMLSSYPSEILKQYTDKYNWHTVELELPRAAGHGRKVEVLTMNYKPE
jgi:DNA adenine methylase